jgi:hypothetical protein
MGDARWRRPVAAFTYTIEKDLVRMTVPPAPTPAAFEATLQRVLRHVPRAAPHGGDVALPIEDLVTATHRRVWRRRAVGEVVVPLNELS